MTLSDFINRHAGQEAWLFGKGPSLKDFNFSTAGPLRFAINDVIAHVPDCLYGFANDGVARWADAYAPGQILFQPARCLGEYDSTQPGAVLCDVVAYPDDYNDERLAWSRERLAADGLCVRRGTLGSALQIIYIMGIRKLTLVGIDGGNTHADGFQWRTRLRHDHWKDYDAIKHAAIDAAEIMGITLKFYNQDKAMEPDGKVFIKMTRTSLAEGKHCCAGEILKVNPRVARDLIAADAAIIYTPPVRQPDPPPIVQATASEAPQKAIIQTVKGKKGRR